MTLIEQDRNKTRSLSSCNHILISSWGNISNYVSANIIIASCPVMTLVLLLSSCHLKDGNDPVLKLFLLSECTPEQTFTF